MSVHENFGIATPKVEILTGLPNVKPHQEVFNIDVTAFSWLAFQNSPFLSPLQTEQLEDRYHNWAACHPAKRQFYVDNLMLDAVNSTNEIISEDKPFITWKPVSTKGPVTPGVIQQTADKYKSYQKSIPDDTTDPASQVPDQFGTIHNDEYVGPRWNNQTHKVQPLGNDKDIYEDLLEAALEIKDELKVDDLLEETQIEQESILAVNQAEVHDGLWWGIESSDFLEEDMPFWVTIAKPKSPPAPNNFETKFIISLGIDSNDNSDRYDIVLRFNKKPQLIDYNDVEIGNPESRPNIREFESDASKLSTDMELIDIGIMTSGGRLIIIVNGEQLIYTRIEKTGNNENVGQIKVAKIKKGKIRVYGTNVQATIMAYPMTFAPLSVLSFPLPKEKEIDTEDGTIRIPIQYSASDYQGEPTGKPICVLPTSPAEKINRYGVDCEEFEDENGILMLEESFGLHLEGQATFKNVNLTQLNLNTDKKYANLPDANFYVLLMEPENREGWLATEDFEGYKIPYGKTPYFFSIKGVDTAFRRKVETISDDVSDDLVTVSENAATPDYFHVKKTASIMLYNEYGKYNSLRDRQKGIRISWGWNNNVERTFTGVIVNTSTSEVAGKETITLQCEDYMHILKANPIINSPFYDGMVGWYAVRDIAKRAGLDSFFRDWESHLDYFLPSGYSFSKPKMRFKSTETLFQAMMNIVQRFQAYIYFDGDGGFHIDKLPGGLYSRPVPPYTNFTTNPAVTGKILILEEKSVQYDFNSTTNHISIITLDRDTRQPIIYARAATGSNDRLAFKKKALKDEPAYGSLDVAKAVALDLSVRVFKPIRKTSFKTIGDSSIIDPLSYITVDGVIFRLTTIKRTYDANSNDFHQTYEAEWLGG